jgi:ketosteroid isomerase-like protein
VSQENVEAFRRSSLLTDPSLPESEWAASFQRLFHPDVEWVIAKEHPAARTVVGYDEIADYLREWQAMLPGVRFEADRLLDAGEKVLAIGRASGTGAGSGAEIDVPLALLSTFREGLIVRIQEYLNPDEALKAVGLEE